ncbi:hypothetical protein Pcinc_019993 [Petrolisthes cinctipes]|uniref:Ionotropic glutamate receptor L-glutamate and glycine-binding domain-containing protein n=1 Tax=Petrolisthes cinctipes TaxID=88211 RepID=A0AAE1FJ20_PETCI|nr:hypothetical protein Pcinc_019993 [Petrolisthes cinctipes]
MQDLNLDELEELLDRVHSWFPTSRPTPDPPEAIYTQSVWSSRQASTVVDVTDFLRPPAAINSSNPSHPTSSSQHRSQVLRQIAEGDPTLPCRTIILDITLPPSPPPRPFSASYTHPSLSFLTSLKLPLWPDTRVVGVGGEEGVTQVFSHPSLKDTIHALYLAITPTPTPSNFTPDTIEAETTCVSKGACVRVYSRCLYCLEGRPGVRMLASFTPSVSGKPPTNTTTTTTTWPNPFHEGRMNLHGHRVRVVAKSLFPFMEFTADNTNTNNTESGTTVTPRDSLDVRMLNTVAHVLNFTYEMRMAVDDQWGTQVDGEWTGMVGTLAEERADMSMMLFWSYDRKKVIDFTRIYTSEPFIMVTHKPRPQPQHLALVRPFVVDLWVAVLVSTLVAGVVLWSLQKGWAAISNAHADALDLTSALMYTWGAMMQNTITRLPTNTTGQMLVGWWWVFCILITTTYRSSLIAHLTVPTTSPPIDYLHQLLDLPGATWGIEPGYGLGWDWFKLNTNPSVQEMFKVIKVLSTEEHMNEVLKGRHAFFTWKYYIKTIIASRYTDTRGNTPIHVGREEFIPGSTGWGVRKGLPFLDPIDRIHDSLDEAGLIDYWLEKLFETTMRKTRVLQGDDGDGGGGEYLESGMVDGSGRGMVLVLNLNHLQGAFYLLFLGYIAAALTLVCERLAHGRPSSPSSSSSSPHKSAQF